MSNPHESGMSSIALIRCARVRTGSAYLLALIIVAAGVSALWYRAYYNIWPGQGATTRVHWCERDYQQGGPPRPWHQATAGSSLPVRAVGEYPPLGLTRQELYAPIVPHAQPSSCATAVYLRVGPARYQAYLLLGGP